MTRRRRLLLRVGLAVLLGPVLLLGLGEAWVRLRHPAYADQWRALASHPRWARTLRPGAAGRLRALDGGYDTRFAINAQGLREAREVGPKDPGRPRVVCVGDSNTFGLGVDDDEPWVRHLGPAFDAVNAGWASGYAPDCACLWLEEVGLGLEPDLVLQQLTPANDLEDLAARSAWETDATGRLVAVRHAWDRRVPPAIQALAFPRYLARQVWPALRGGEGGVPASGAGELRPVDQQGLQRLGPILARERSSLEGRGVRLAVLVIPCHSRELPLDDATRALLQAQREAVVRCVTEAGLTLLDPEGSPEWTGAARPVFHTDGHLTASGNRALGAWVRRWLETSLPTGSRSRTR